MVLSDTGLVLRGKGHGILLSLATQNKERVKSTMTVRKSLQPTERVQKKEENVRDMGELFR